MRYVLALAAALLASELLTSTRAHAYNEQPGGGGYSITQLGGVCNGNPANTVADTAAMNRLSALRPTAPLTVTFPGLCVIAAGAYPMSNINMVGVNGGGIQLVAGSSIANNTFDWGATTGPVIVKDMVVDLNGAAPVAVVPRKNFGFFVFRTGVNLTFTGNHVINGGQVPAATGLAMLSGYGLASCEISNNLFSFNFQSNYYNQSINLGADNAAPNANPTTNCNIHHNRHINTGIEYIMQSVGNPTPDPIAVPVMFDIHDEYITGVGFGACIGNGAGGANPVPVVMGHIHHITCTNTMTTLDENATKLNGIQEWNNGVLIDHNVIDNTCAGGILIGGKSQVLNNVITRSGSCPNQGTFPASSIQLIATTFVSPAGSVIQNNSGGNDGMTQYCVSDGTTVGPYSVGPNNCQGAQGAYNVIGEGAFTAPLFSNRVVNPCFQVDQRHAGALQSANGGGAGAPLWAADQWHYAQTAPGLTFQITSAARSVRRCQWSEQVTVATPETPAAGDVYTLFQSIPIGNVGDLAYGFRVARPMLFGFCVQTNLPAGTVLPWSVRNISAATSYVGTYTFAPTTGNEQCFSFIIPGDTAHFLAGAANVEGFRVNFDLGSGSNFQAPAGQALQWISGAYTMPPGAVHSLVAGAVGDKLVFSDVRLQATSADVGWSPPSMLATMSDALAYYQMSFPYGTAPAQNAGVAGASCVNGVNPSVAQDFAPPMNTAPKMTTYNPSAANANWRDTTASADVTAVVPAAGAAGAASSTNAMIGSTGAVSGADVSCIHWTADAGL